MPFLGTDGSGSDNEKEERLCIAVMQQPPTPIGRIDRGGRWDWLRMRMPLSDIGTGCFACPPRRVDRRLMPSLGAMKPGTGALVAVHRHRHNVDNDRAAIAQVPPQQYTACLSCAARMLDKPPHDPPGRNADLKSGSVRPCKDQWLA